MKAIIIHEPGDPKTLSYEDWPDPHPGPGEALVRVRAAGVNHLDLFMRRGLPGVQLPVIPGGDVAGEVIAVGAGVTTPRPGAAVIVSPVISCGHCRWCLAGADNFCPEQRQLGRGINGGYAELCVVPAVNALPMPESLDFVGAASLPIVVTTVWHMLVKLARLQLGETILVLGAGSGVGSMAIQVSKLFGARVLATAGSAAKLERAAALGADEGINHTTQDIAREARRLTDGQGVDVVFEHVGEATWERSLRALRRGGRLVTCGATTGNRGKLNLDALFWNNTQIFGNRMGGKGDLLEALRFFADGRLRPIIDTTYPLAEAARAHERLEAREQFGKVVLVPS
jgi:NADPH:quinone reductase-like Zn-dependent oxidoreductase